MRVRSVLPATWKVKSRRTVIQDQKFDKTSISAKKLGMMTHIFNLSYGKNTGKTTPFRDQR
jgi:hypothetical protein